MSCTGQCVDSGATYIQGSSWDTNVPHVWYSRQSICNLNMNQTARQMLYGCSHHSEDTRCSLCQWRWLSRLNSHPRLAAEQWLGKKQHKICFIPFIWPVQCCSSITLFQPFSKGSLLTTECVRQLCFPCAELCRMKSCWKFWVSVANWVIWKHSVHTRYRRHLLTSKGLCDSHTLYTATQKFTAEIKDICCAIN